MYYRNILLSFYCVILLNIVGCGLLFPPSIQFVPHRDEFTGEIYIEAYNLMGLRSIDGYSTSNDYLLPKKKISEEGVVTYSIIYSRNFTSCDTVYPQEIIFLVNGKRYVLEFEGSNYEYHSSYCNEWAWASVDKTFFANFENANDVKLRVIGTSRNIEYKFDDTYLACYRTFYQEYCNQ